MAAVFENQIDINTVRYLLADGPMTFLGDVLKKRPKPVRIMLFDDVLLCASQDSSATKTDAPAADKAAYRMEWSIDISSLRLEESTYNYVVGCDNKTIGVLAADGGCRHRVGRRCGRQGVLGADRATQDTHLPLHDGRAVCAGTQRTPATRYGILAQELPRSDRGLLAAEQVAHLGRIVRH